MKTFLVMIIAVLLVEPAAAATFRVEKDGSAPYSII